MDEIKYSKEEYIAKLKEIAKEYNKEKLLPMLPWILHGDRYFGTSRGIMRARCALSLEYLFKTIVKPGGDWSDSHRLIAGEAEKNNLYWTYLGVKASGSLVKLSTEFKRKVKDCGEFKRDKLSLFLCYRGWFKTTLLSEALTLQMLILNPNARILIKSGSTQNAETIVSAVKSHFMHNELFRYLFPEYCPIANKSGKVEFGTQSKFTLPNRTVMDYREASVMAASPSTKLAGYHFDFQCLDDLIDEQNVTTEDQLKKAKESYQLGLSLFDNPSKPFLNVIGTRYHSLDLYADLISSEADDKGQAIFKLYNPLTKLLDIVKERV